MNPRISIELKNPKAAADCSSMSGNMEISISAPAPVALKMLTTAMGSLIISIVRVSGGRITADEALDRAFTDVRQYLAHGDEGTKLDTSHPISKYQ